MRRDIEGAPQEAADGGELRDPVPYTNVHHAVRRFLEPTQDLIAVGLALLLFGVAARVLLELGAELFTPRLNFRSALSDALVVLVLMELQRLIIIYLRDHHISVDVMIEVTIVAALREVLLLGAVEIEPLRLLALTAFLVTLGILLRYGDLRASQRRVHHHGAGQRQSLLVPPVVTK
jgi:uncharacterized membrane protein (DUF373 family)